MSFPRSYLRALRSAAPLKLSSVVSPRVNLIYLRALRSAAPLKRQLVANASELPLGDLRALRSAAPLKHGATSFTFTSEGASPRSPERGPVEAPTEDIEAAKIEAISALSGARPR